MAKNLITDRISFEKEFKACKEEFNNSGTNPILEEKINNLLSIFKEMPDNEIKEYLSPFLSPEETKVIINYKKNTEITNDMLSKLMAGEPMLENFVRDYFFNSEYINKLLLSDEYREMLDFVQHELTLKVKVELFMDMCAYFSYGCYEEDKKNPKKWPSKDLSTKQKYELVKKLSEKRNIGVLVKKDDSGRCSIQCGEIQHSKNGLAKSGYIDRVKITPSGLVVMLGTSDGSLSLYKEPLQLRDHTKALSVGISNGELQHNGITYTKENICDVSFNILTKHKSSNSHHLQKKMNECGLNSEAMRFLNTSFVHFLAEPGIDDYFKYQCSMNGIACSGLDKEKLANLENFIIETLQTINSNLKNTESLLNMHGGRAEIIEYLHNFASFLDESQRITDFTKNKKIIKELKKIQDSACQLKDLFPSTRSIGELINGFSEERLKERRDIFNEQFKISKEKEFQLQNKLNPQKYQELEQKKISLEKDSGVDPIALHEILVYNKTLDEFKKQEKRGRVTAQTSTELLRVYDIILLRNLHTSSNPNNSYTIRKNAPKNYADDSMIPPDQMTKIRLTQQQLEWLEVDEAAKVAKKYTVLDQQVAERLLLSELVGNTTSKNKTTSSQPSK